MDTAFWWLICGVRAGCRRLAWEAPRPRNDHPPLRMAARLESGRGAEREREKELLSQSTCRARVIAGLGITCLRARNNVL
eukprot:1013904-Rhodomonas_salina.1